jgi:phenylpropionate dioxygenase-like ring-hydroxylating dioxygenase large terminal subunit
MSSRTSCLLPPAAYCAAEWWQVEQEGVFGQTYNLVAYESQSGHADGSIRCWYHGWEYTLDGSLARVPQRSGQLRDLDMEASGLSRFAVGCWAGMVFVHPGADPPPFEDSIGEFVHPDKAGPYDWDDLVAVDHVDVPLRCNWKLYIVV